MKTSATERVRRRRKRKVPRVLPYSEQERKRMRTGYVPPRMLTLVKDTPMEEERVNTLRALADGELLTGHQAALRVGVPVGTFNYHLRNNHIPYLTTAGGIHYVYLADAEEFARRLKEWRSARSYAAFKNEQDEGQDEGQDGEPETPDEQSVASGA